MRGIVLYGPPASGKDTITDALVELDPRCRLFKRLKAGPGATATYRMIGADDLDRLRAAGQLVWTNRRYGATYVVDRPGLLDALADGIPVLHLGQVQAVDAVRHATPDGAWLMVELRRSRDTAHTWLIARRSVDTEARLAAWDATERLPAPDLSLDTGNLRPRAAAETILTRVNVRDNPPS